MADPVRRDPNSWHGASTANSWSLSRGGITVPVAGSCEMPALRRRIPCHQRPDTSFFVFTFLDLAVAGCGRLHFAAFAGRT